jgi:hypothetical protein
MCIILKAHEFYLAYTDFVTGNLALCVVSVKQLSVLKFGGMSPDPLEARTFGGRLSCLRVLVKHGLSCCHMTLILIS